MAAVALLARMLWRNRTARVSVLVGTALLVWGVVELARPGLEVNYLLPAEVALPLLGGVGWSYALYLVREDLEADCPDTVDGS